MNVFVLTRGFDCDGESASGVYATLDGAKAAAVELCKKYNIPERPEWKQWLANEWRQVFPIGREFIIREEIVQ